MADPIAQTAALFLAALFGWAALVKLVKPRVWLDALGGYAFPVRAVRIVAFAVPVAEGSVAALALAGRTKTAAAGAVALLALFSLAITRARTLGGDDLPCGCFGGRRVADFRLMLLRNVLLGCVAAVVLLAPEVPPLTEWNAPSAGEIVPVALVLIGAGIIAWVGRTAIVSFGSGRRS